MQKEQEHKPHVMSLQICSMIGYLLGLYPAKTAVSPRSPPLEAMREGKHLFSQATCFGSRIKTFPEVEKLWTGKDETSVKKRKKKNSEL